MKRGDLIIIAVALTIALGVFGIFSLINANTDNPYAVVEVDGVELYRLPLDAAIAIYTAENGQGLNEIQVGDGSAAIVHANCKDQLCVQRGKLTGTGQIAVCLPNRVVLRIEGGKSNDDDVDVIVGN